MGRQDDAVDVEALRKSGGRRRRGGCLDVFLVVSVLFLFVAVTAGAAGGVMVVMELRSRLDRQSMPETSPSVMGTPGDAPDHTYKKENFVYLEATSAELKNSTMTWAAISFSVMNSVGSNYMFDEAQHSLTVRRTGSYFMYINLNFTCTYSCNAGIFSVDVADKLTCKVKLPKVANSTPVSQKCWTVSHLDGQRLLTQMTVPKEGLQNWRMEQGSGFGMFLVD